LLAIWIIEPFEELFILLPYIAWIKKEMLQTHDIFLGVENRYWSYRFHRHHHALFRASDFSSAIKSLQYGQDPDHAHRNLVSAIEQGEFPRWNVKLQIMPERDAETSPLNPFDLTKVWAHEERQRLVTILLSAWRNAHQQCWSVCFYISKNAILSRPWST
jgi:catalase